MAIFEVDDSRYNHYLSLTVPRHCQDIAKHFTRQQTTTRDSKHELVAATCESFFLTLTQ